MACCAHKKAPPQVDGQHLVEVGGRQVLAAGGDLDAGVVDQVVGPSVLVEHAVEHLRHLVLAGDVGADQERAGAAIPHPLHAAVEPVLGDLLGRLGAPRGPA